jgi:predicted amidohydrolase YtcJ
MGSFGALLSEPYADNPDHSGVQTTDDKLILALAQTAREQGYQVTAHTIGDLANTKIIDAYEETIGSDSGGVYRWKIEHAQFLQPRDIQRIGENGYIASMQPLMATSDMKWVESRLGEERGKTTYAWRSLLDAGALLVGGSDVPIESMNPFRGIYAAVTRQDESGFPPGGFNPQERISREEAVRMYTSSAAFAAFREEREGRIIEGFDANLIILDRDITTIPNRELLDIQVLATYQKGELVYSP